ncbi:hypothetical protein JCM17380_24490 [Desulfosporosinus burensis]
MSRARLLYEDKEFRLLKSRDYVVVRKDHPYEFHSHFQKYTGAMSLISLFYKRLIPSEEYFRIAMERIITEAEHEDFAEQRVKQMYFNVNKKGVRGNKRCRRQ